MGGERYQKVKDMGGNWRVRWGGVIALLMVIASVSGCASRAPLPQALIEDPEHRIYVVSEKWHSSLLVAVEDVLPHSQLLREELAPYRYMCVGWGDGDYFTGKDKSLPTAAKALVNSKYSALQLLGYYRSALVQIAPEDRVPVAISREGMKALTEFIEASVKLDAAGAPVPLKAYDANTGVFFEGAEQYSAKNNCNTWVSRALQAAGVPITRENFVRTETVFKQARAISVQQQALGLLPTTYEEKLAESSPDISK